MLVGEETKSLLVVGFEVYRALLVSITFLFRFGGLVDILVGGGVESRLMVPGSYFHSFAAVVDVDITSALMRSKSSACLGVYLPLVFTDAFASS